MNREDITKFITQCADGYKDAAQSELIATLSKEQIVLLKKWRVWCLISYGISAGQIDTAVNIFEQFKDDIEGDKVLNAFKEKEHP